MLFAARSAAALYRLLDILPVFAGDGRIIRHFTFVPGSDFGVGALAALDRTGALTVPWSEALKTSYDLILAASPKGELDQLDGAVCLLPHGAGFNKTLACDGDRCTASGLDPAYLMRHGSPLAAVHALAHPGQRDRLAAHCPPAAARATVVGDPTLDRLLDSRTLRERYRTSIGTGERRLIVLTSTWGPWSLLAARPELPALLATELPVDSYQIAVVAHPNAHSAPGTLNLLEQLPPGVHLADPHEEWAALLVAADALITDHGSAALYGAALGRPVLAACDGGPELLPGTPMARLLAAVPKLTHPSHLPRLLAVYRPEMLRTAADDAFAEQGRALSRLRTVLYRQLDLTPPATPPAEPRLLPTPRHRSPIPTAHAVRVLVTGTDEAPGEAAHAPPATGAPPQPADPNQPSAPGAAAGEPVMDLTVERRLPSTDTPSHHLAAEEDTAPSRQVESAGLLYRRATARPGPVSAAPTGTSAWTAAGWTAHALAAYPPCRTAAVILSAERCVVRRRGHTELLAVLIAPVLDDGRVLRPDPAAILSAVHALPPDPRPAVRTVLDCRVAGRTYRVLLTPATAEESTAELTPQTREDRTAHGGPAR